MVSSIDECALFMEMCRAHVDGDDNRGQTEITLAGPLHLMRRQSDAASTRHAHTKELERVCVCCRLAFSSAECTAILLLDIADNETDRHHRRTFHNI